LSGTAAKIEPLIQVGNSDTFLSQQALGYFNVLMSKDLMVEPIGIERFVDLQ